MPDRAIGIFDSGVGGLTVLQAAMRRLPGESFVYLGDTARVPYGTKSAATVLRYAEQAADLLVGQKVKMLVVACNTASAVALPHLAACFKLPVVGVIEPGAAQAAALSQTENIGVIGTEGTVRSRAYEEAIHACLPNARVTSVACPLFVPLAEEGWVDHEVARISAREYLAPLLAQGIDTLVLGCTHYPLLKPMLRTLLPETLTLVDSAEATAEAIVELLQAEGLCADRTTGERARFLVTDVPERFCRVGQAFLGHRLESVEQVDFGVCADGSIAGLSPLFLSSTRRL